MTINNPSVRPQLDNLPSKSLPQRPAETQGDAPKPTAGKARSESAVERTQSRRAVESVESIKTEAKAREVVASTKRQIMDQPQVALQTQANVSTQVAVSLLR